MITMQVAAFESGDLQLQGEPRPCLPAELAFRSPTEAQVVLREGRYHQVRRMFAACGNHVCALHRTAFAEWQLRDLPGGGFTLLPLA